MAELNNKIVPLLEFMVKKGMIDAEDGAALVFWAIKGKSPSPESLMKHVSNGTLDFVETNGPQDFSWLAELLTSGDLELATLAKDQDQLLSMVNVKLLAKIFLEAESDIDPSASFPENQRDHIESLKSMSQEELALRALDEIYDPDVLLSTVNLSQVYKVGLSRNIFTAPLSFAGKTWIAVRKS